MPKLLGYKIKRTVQQLVQAELIVAEESGRVSIVQGVQGVIRQDNYIDGVVPAVTGSPNPQIASNNVPEREREERENSIGPNNMMNVAAVPQSTRRPAMNNTNVEDEIQKQDEQEREQEQGQQEQAVQEEDRMARFNRLYKRLMKHTPKRRKVQCASCGCVNDACSAPRSGCFRSPTVRTPASITRDRTDDRPKRSWRRRRI